MQSDEIVLLTQKIDQLTALVELQNQRLAEIENRSNGSTQLYERLDLISQQFAAQQRQQDEFNELKNDIMPIVNHMVKLSINELAEIGTEFRSEDLLFLLKRILRDTPLLVELLGRLEGVVDLVDETQLIGQQVFHHTVVQLDELERQGYFAFARSGWGVLEKIVSEFSQEDVDALGDNIVTILTTVKNLTQPEIMGMTNNALSAIQSEPVPEGNASIWSLLKDLSDPQVRKGLARLLNMVKVLADQPNPSQN